MAVIIVEGVAAEQAGAAVSDLAAAFIVVIRPSKKSRTTFTDLAATLIIIVRLTKQSGAAGHLCHTKILLSFSLSPLGRFKCTPSAWFCPCPCSKRYILTFFLSAMKVHSFYHGIIPASRPPEISRTSFSAESLPLKNAMSASSYRKLIRLGAKENIPAYSLRSSSHPALMLP